MISYNIESCFASRVGDAGISDESFNDALGATRSAAAVLAQKVESGELPLFNVYDDSDPKINLIENESARIRSNYTHVYVLGTGGSTLCPQALLGARNLSTPNAPSIHFFDNIDPHTLENTLKTIPAEKSLFLVISKSGGTIETLSHFAMCLDFMESQHSSLNIADHFLLISDPKDNPIREVASRFYIRTLEHESGIGGRFSILTNVGLLPAAIAGMDIRAILAGAKEIADSSIANSNTSTRDAVASSLAFMHQGGSTHILLPYLDRMRAFGVWVSQIWAESLGKDGHGTLPYAGVGTLDQHSQLQLWLGGPKDKLMTIITQNRVGEGTELKQQYLPSQSLDYVVGKTMGDVISSAQYATRDSLINAGVPVRVIELDTFDDKQLGKLVMHFILETVLVGYSLQINPFDQPAVEDGKIRTKALLEKAA